MLTLQQIKSNPAEVVERLAIKGFDGKEAIDKVLALDEQRRLLQLDNDNKAAELNRIAASIGSLMKEGKREEAEQAKSQVAGLKEAQRTIAQQLAETEQEQHNLLVTIPNLPCAMVPRGTSAVDNVVEKTGGPMPVMFLFIFNDYAAGLSYYYFLTLLITIAQTYIFRAFVNEDKMRARMMANAAKPKKKSGFMARLEEAQRQQQAMLREQQKKNGKGRR